jgi:hypothetical protein
MNRMSGEVRDWLETLTHHDMAVFINAREPVSNEDVVEAAEDYLQATTDTLVSLQRLALDRGRPELLMSDWREGKA